jgi:ribose transport system ATP-binding protein/rhamnose transport system ATP-binding protein
VLKDGKLAGTRKVAETSTDELIRLMVGRDIHLARSAKARSAGPVVLEADDISAPPLVRRASIRLHAGEIVCMAGLIGSGRSEFCEAIFGARRRLAGTIRVEGRQIDPQGPWDGKRAGIGMVPEDRKASGLFLTMDIVNNLAVTVLRKVSSGANFSESKAEALARSFVDELRIATPSVRQTVANLSGGNQQKVLLAKWLAMEPKVLIVDEPTRGVDVGARSEIYRLLRGLADRGVALLVVSSDLPEVLALADRIVVMAEGRTVGELAGEGASEEQVLRLATKYTESVADVREEQVSENA